ncbi:reverse transcriptase [Corchorus capsularis]|uniref:Reverse transcriptase n=1 Tax=Corchorus capsularis TaxID=210143 RepID=A0A1R3GH72_COCAP|nr:reverse transcriptase [Corchorus capsularis]
MYRAPTDREILGSNLTLCETVWVQILRYPVKEGPRIAEQGESVGAVTKRVETVAQRVEPTRSYTDEAYELYGDLGLDLATGIVPSTLGLGGIGQTHAVNGLNKMNNMGSALGSEIPWIGQFKSGLGDITAGLDNSVPKEGVLSAQNLALLQNDQVRQLLADLAVASPSFVFGATTSTSSPSRRVRKWKKAARASQSTSLNLVAGQSNVKEGRKRLPGSSILMPNTSGLVKRSREHAMEVDSTHSTGQDVEGLAPYSADNSGKDAAAKQEDVVSGYDYCFAVDCNGRSGGLAFLWMADNNVSLLSYSFFHIDVCIGSSDIDKWCFKRHESWALLRSLCDRSSLPWLCAGDFNEIISNAEKEGGALRSSHQIDLFKSVVDYCGFHELLVVGPLMTWHYFGNLQHNITYKKKEYELLYSDCGAGNMVQFEKCRLELDELRREELLWRQRSKALRLKEGDSNTKGIQHIISDYFKGIFKSANPSNESIQKVLSSMNSRLNIDMRSRLDAPFTANEVKEAAFQMSSSKAPGPDGFSPGFYQRCWHIVGAGVTCFVLDFLNNGKPFPDINHTNIVLVPKLKQPRLASDFRPISLCNVIFKILSKVLANRLKEILPSIIGETHSAFVLDRMIYDNAMIAFKTMHFMRNKRTGRQAHMALKLDLSKAYDRAEWSFLEEIMRAMGFPTKWVSLVMKCVQSVSYSVIVNDEQCQRFIPSRGLCQDDPLSPYLFLLCMGVFSNMIESANETGLLHGIAVSKTAPRVSHLFFADDIFLFLRANMIECQAVLSLLKDFESTCRNVRVRGTLSKRLWKKRSRH